jgi:salicylate hydroxylase
LIAKTGELLGTQHWDEELLRETRGEYLFAHVKKPYSRIRQINYFLQLSDLVKLLYDVAISRGANIRLGTRAISIDPQNGTIETAAGETVHADVIVGADGISGLARRALLQEEGVRKPADKHSMWMYRCASSDYIYMYCKD